MIRIALYRGISLTSRLIRWQTRSPYSHAAILLNDGRVIEAWTDGVCLAEPGEAHCEGTPVEVFRLVGGIDEDSAKVIERAAMSQKGKPYDFRSVLRFVTRAKESTSSQEKWFCSELVFWAFERASIHLLHRTEAWEVSPGLLARSPLLVQDHMAGFETSRKMVGCNGASGRAPGRVSGAPAASGVAAGVSAYCGSRISECGLEVAGWEGAR